MDRSDGTPPTEEVHPEENTPTLPAGQAEHLARRRLLKAAVATAGAVGATAAASGGSKVFARSLLQSLSPNTTHAPSTPTPTATKSPTATATTTTPAITCKTCVMDPNFSPETSAVPQEHHILSFTAFNVPPGTYDLIIFGSPPGSGHPSGINATGTLFILENGGNGDVLTRQFAANTAPQCANTFNNTTTVSNPSSAFATVTVTGPSNADLQLIVKVKPNFGNQNLSQFGFVGVISAHPFDENALCTSGATLNITTIG